MKKKVVSFIMAFAIVFMTVSTVFANTKAIYTKSKIIVDGNEVAFEAYNIGGNNYFKLRDVAKAISGSKKQFEVSWNAVQNAVEMTSETPYTPTGGELLAGDGQDKVAKPGTQKFIKDGAQVEFTAYNINGNNYIKLRDLGVAFRFEVYWDAPKNSVVVDTSREYTGIAPEAEKTYGEGEEEMVIPYYADFPKIVDVGAIIGAPVLERIRENSDLGYITVYIYDKGFYTAEKGEKFIDILTEIGHYYIKNEDSITYITQEGYAFIFMEDELYLAIGVVEEKLSDEVFNNIKKTIKEQSA